MGNHIHNDHPNYRRVVEMVQSGKLGKISRVHVWKTGGGAGGGGVTRRRPSGATDDGAADARLRFLARARAEPSVSSAAVARLVPPLVGLFRRHLHRLLGAHLRRRDLGHGSAGSDGRDLRRRPLLHDR